ncbi:MAG: IclR family transcriptional regulator [Anaerolineae bacterium]|nr:IclR family transcriptional regulator [Anaerolineae bacterium]
MVKKSGVSLKTVNRALDVLLLFDREHPEWSVVELSQALDLHRSIVYRILCTFEQRGVVTRSHPGGRYRLGLKLVELANVVLASMDLRPIAHPVMERLVRDTGESAFLTVVSEDESVCIEKVDSPQPIRSMLSIGDRSLLHAGASNKLLLAYLPADTIDELIARGLEPMTPHTITDPTQLKDNLAKIRQQGWAYTVGELTPGAAAISVPLRDSNGTVVAALSIAGLASRFSEDRLPMLISATRQAADEISAQLVTWHKTPTARQEPRSD